EIMSKKEEQLQELEALTCIYPEEIEVISEDPYPKFKLYIKSTHDTNVDSQHKSALTLEVKFDETYPEQPPKITIIDSENVDDINFIENEIKKICEENLCMPMIFTLSSHLSEQLSIQAESHHKRFKEHEEQKRKAEEEAERSRFEGTCVSVESFIKWKVKFDAEMAELKNIKIDESEPKKLTGRQLFEKDRSLYESDIKFLSGDGGEVVEVDESLFQDIIDLDLEDDASTNANVGDLSDTEQ
ncbi:unnamed protein product, partial [Didymodactylos carnosus]